MPKTNAKATRRPATAGKPTTAAEDIMAGMRQLADVVRSGRRPADVFPSRTYAVPPPTAWPPDRVRGLRRRLGIAQGTFARLVGISTILVQGWEQGKRTPAPVAARLLDTIASDPAAWLRTIGAELPAVPAIPPAAAGTPAVAPTTPGKATRRPPKRAALAASAH